MARLKWLIIPLFVVFLMSHNAGAVSTVIDLNSYELKYSYNGTQDCGYTDASLDVTSTWYCYLATNDQSLFRISSSQSFELEKGDIIEFYFIVSSNQNVALIYNDFIQPINSTSGANVVDIQLMDNSSFHVYGESSLIPSGYYFNKIYKITMIQNTNRTTPIGLGNNRNVSLYRVNVDGGFPSNFRVSLSIRNGQIWRYVGSQENKEQEQATQEQSEAGDSAADSSTDAVEGATQNLFSAMGSIVSAVKDTPATNCLIDITTTGNSSAFTSAIGSINLCADVPSNILNTVRGLAALVIVPAVLYACYSICIKMYRTFTEVQNT